jgi:peptide deformylase
MSTRNKAHLDSPKMSTRMADIEDIVELDPEAEDSTPPPELDPETIARRDAALRHVRKLGDPVLRATAVLVDRFDDALSAEIERMGLLMSDALGIGLAATQIGVLHRVLVYRTDAEHDITALVNPVLEWSSEDTDIAEEGCLSLPGVHIEVERPAQVRVRARDAAGAEVLVEAEGLQARVIQHEIDHLDGVLILDRVSRAVRKEAMRAMREAQREGAQREDVQREEVQREGAQRGDVQREDSQWEDAQRVPVQREAATHDNAQRDASPA